jgi:hypothetical protein
MGLGGQRHVPLYLPPEKEPLYIIQYAGWAPGQVWTGAKIVALTGIRPPDRPAGSKSLYRLSYPGPLIGPLTEGNNRRVENNGKKLNHLLSSSSSSSNKDEMGVLKIISVVGHIYV